MDIQLHENQHSNALYISQIQHNHPCLYKRSDSAYAHILLQDQYSFNIGVRKILLSKT
jgi:hypothetical protein